MVNSSRILFAIAANWGAKAAHIIAQFVLLPVLFRALDPAELGLWFLFGNPLLILPLLDFGLFSIFTREIAFVHAGPNREAAVPLGELLDTGRRVYDGLAAGLLALGLTVGMWVISLVRIPDDMVPKAIAAWVLMVVGYAAYVRANYSRAIICGAGDVGWDGVWQIVLAVAIAAGQMVIVLSGGGLVGLAAAWLAAGLFARFALDRWIRDRYQDLVGGQPKWSRRAFERLLRPSFQVWMTTLGGFLILKTNQYFIGLFRGASDISGYSAAYFMVYAAYSIAVSVAASASVYVSSLWEAGDHEGAQVLVTRCARFGLLMMLGAILTFSTAGYELIHLWVGGSHFVGYGVLWTFCFMLALEAQHVILATACHASGETPFALWALGAGILNIVLMVLLIQPLGLWGVALATALAQLFTNNWYTVYRSLKRLEFPFSRYMRRVALPLAVTFTLGWLAIRIAVPDWLGPVARLAACAAVAALCVAALQRIWMGSPATKGV